MIRKKKRSYNFSTEDFALRTQFRTEDSGNIMWLKRLLIAVLITVMVQMMMLMGIVLLMLVVVIVMLIVATVVWKVFAIVLAGEVMLKIVEISLGRYHSEKLRELISSGIKMPSATYLEKIYKKLVPPKIHTHLVKVYKKIVPPKIEFRLIPLPLPGIARLWKEKLSKEVEQVETELREERVKIEIGPAYLICVGTKEGIDESEARIMRLNAEIISRDKDYSWVGADKWFFNEEGQRHMKGIEALRNVVIEIRKGVVRHGEQLTPAADRRGKRRKKWKRKMKVVKEAPTDPFHQCDFTTKEGLEISWTYGDIAQETADILVSSAASNLNNPTTVGKALNSVGGLSFLAACKPHFNVSTGEIVTTTGGNLACQYVIHAVCCHWGPNTSGSEETLRCLLRKILLQCNKRSARSVAMPLIGTGNLMFPEAVVLRVMKEEFEKFSLLHPFGTLKTIKLVRYNQAMKPNTVQDRNVQASTRPVTSSSCTSVMPSVAGSTAESVKLQVFARSNEDADLAFEDIEKFIQSHVTTEMFEHEKSREIMRRYWDELNRFAKDCGLTITCLDKTLSIVGMSSKMNEANDKIRHLILRILREEQRTNQFSYISKNVQWYYADPLGLTELAYSAQLNGEIEAARMDGKTMVPITGSDGLQYVVDFIQMVAKSKRDGSTRKLTRKWTGSGTESSLPYYWTPQREDQVVQLVQLSRSSLEYMEVVNHFASHGGNAYQVYMVERIQNPRLYAAFSVVKKTCMRGRDNEMRLFHGTDAANILSINANNFSRSFAGVNGTKYGNGVYFARDASYSMNYARIQHKGSRPKLYMAKVLVGNYVNGYQGMKAPPFKEDPNNPGVRYDSVVNDPSNPSIYVIFQDNQCYPEYLITLLQ